MGRSVCAILLWTLVMSASAQSPGGINTNLQLWLRAENYTGGATWTDQSGNGRNATKSGTVGTTARYNFQPVPTGLSTTNYFSVAHHANLNTNSGAISVFAVGLAGGGTYSPFVAKTADQTWPNGWVLATSDPMSHLGFTTGNWDGVGTTNVAKQTGVSTTIPYIASGFGSGGTQNVSVCNNGTAVATNTSTSTTSNVPLRVGFDGDAYGFNNGNVAEVIVYNSNLSAAQRQRVWTYLAIKYGITLNNGGGADHVSSTGVTVWNATTNAGYNNNTFGIALDNGSGLHQRQSVSINAGPQPVIAHGSTLVALNSSGTNLTTNNSYLIAGSDNGATNFGTAISGLAGLNARLDRIWKVQETGTIGNVTIAWPDTDASIKLLVSNDAVFNGSDNAIASTAITINGVGYRQATVNLTSGQFFTFANWTTAPGGHFNSLSLWLTADAAGVLPGSNATAWNDLSRSNNPVETVGTRTLQAPDAAHNFQPYFNAFSSANHFKDVNSSLAPENSFLATEMTLFAVARINSATNDGRIMGIDDGNNNGADPGLSIDDASVRFHRVSTSTTNLTSPIDASVGRSGVFSAYTAGTTLGTGMDGIYNSTTFTAGGGMTGDILMIGYGNQTVVGALPGDLQEVIWYKRSLNSTEIKQVESYLAIKHGITLGGNSGTASTYNYLNSAATVVWNKVSNAGFNNDIAGIGRDDVSRLDQRQSNSVNAGGSVTMSLGTIAASNAANTNTFAQDRSFLIWGHDGAGHNTVFDDPNCFSQLPTGVQARLQRRWKVQRTNFAQNVTVGIDQSALVGYTPITNLRLLVDNDGANWTDATVYSGATSSGGRIVFSGVDFSTGSFFTLATIDFAGTPLPVELIAFGGEVVGPVNELDWHTATEWNNDHFDVERSADGAHFDPIGRIVGAGSSQQVHAYAFTDRYPIDGLNYYRLNQVDHDGTSTLSSVIVLKNESTRGTDCVLRTLDPNGLFAFSCTVPEGTDFALYTATGQPLKAEKFDGSGTKEVDLRPLAAGVYYVRLVDGDKVKSYKLLRP